LLAALPNASETSYLRDWCADLGHWAFDPVESGYDAANRWRDDRCNERLFRSEYCLWLPNLISPPRGTADRRLGRRAPDVVEETFGSLVKNFISSMVSQFFLWNFRRSIRLSSSGDKTSGWSLVANRDWPRFVRWFHLFLAANDS